MDYRIDCVFADDRGDELDVTNIADDERRFRRDSPLEAGRKPIEDNDVFARVQQLPDHMAANIARTTRHQHRHEPPFECCRSNNML